MRIRTNIGPFCSAITLTERKWATNWTNPTISETPTNAAKADFGPTGEQLYTVPLSFRTVNESMTDSLGVDGRFRDCHHSLETNEFFNPLCRTLYPEAAQTNASLGKVTASMINSLITFSAAPSVDMAAMADEAMAFMLPHVNEGDSLVNFVLELKDVKKSVSKAGIALSRVFGNPRNLAGKMLNPRRVASYSDISFKLRPGRKKMLKDILDRLAGAHLEGVYGVQLTVKDIVSMYTNLAELQYKLKVLMQYANRPQVRHYRRFIPASAGVPANREWRYQSPSQSNWITNLSLDSSPQPRLPIVTVKKTRWTLRPVYHATMRYTYTLPLVEEAYKEASGHFSSLANELKKAGGRGVVVNFSDQEEFTDAAMKDSLGLRLDPGIVWDAIPLSFIVDWVVDVSSFLHSFARDNFPIETIVTDFCHSVKYAYEAEISQAFQCNSTMQFAPAPFSEWTDEKHRLRDVGVVYRRTFKAYDRVRFTPGTHMIAIKRLKLRQAAIAGSLLITRTLTARR